MKLCHTSPKEITEIDRFGTFDDCLFFSVGNYYQMSAVSTFKYYINAEDMDFINASQLYDAEIVAKIASYFDIDEDLAESLLDGSDSVFNHENIDDYENNFWMQAKRGECAKKMGYDGCKDRDEQGGVYIIPMFGRESLLNVEK